MSSRKSAQSLRSHRWLGLEDLRSFGHRSRLRQFGYDAADWQGKPVIGIINTWSDINACHGHLRDARRGREARRLGGGRLSAGTAGDVARRAVREALDHALSQLPGDGVRGTAAQPSDRRRGADGRLRQDHARPDHGRDQHGPPGDLCAGRPDAARQLARQGTRFRHRCLEILGREARRQHQRGRLGRDRGRHLALLRHLHGDGHRRHHDGDRRGARADPAGRLVDPGRRFQPPAHVLQCRTPHRRHGVGGPDAAEDHHPGRGRQRHPRAYGDGRLDQRHHPSDRDGAARGLDARHAALRRHLARDSGDRQCAAVGELPDGGFLLCRRPARADGGDRRTSSISPASPSPARRWARTSPARPSITATSSTRWAIRSMRKARPLCSPAISRPAAA